MKFDKAMIERFDEVLKENHIDKISIDITPTQECVQDISLIAHEDNDWNEDRCEPGGIKAIDNMFRFLEEELHPTYPDIEGTLFLCPEKNTYTVRVGQDDY